ncbi:CAP domain-containing protein [uncultured Winogradskyella sp.]|mgnify:FL=1|uniref:CAP domain-containing protein n=1 Tax=uncultured Winogradskyella sp. TaxID=395353 RepID=UPI002630005B|nr:CAP domain-containing protein [uncultured Winogradskyella sp.]|tara:strand:- start:4444 stop:4938 length:495 start_codon:yes stop_codon:yes gene_type:complete
MKTLKHLPFLAIIVLFSFTSCSTESIEDDISAIEVPSTPQAKVIEIEIMELINAHRISLGLNVLQNHDTVKAVALTHTNYMIEEANVSHDYFFLRKESLETNANANDVTENVGYGFYTAEGVVNAWLNSPSHRANIEGDHTDFDVSAEQNAEGKWYFTNMFIKR